MNNKISKPPHQLFASVGIWFATLCWGSAYVAARYLLEPSTPGIVALSPLMLASLRFGVASLVFLAPLLYALAKHRIAGRDLLLLVLVGQLTFTLYYWLQYIGIQQTNAGVSSVLGVGLIPLFTALLAPFFGHGRFTLRLGAALCPGFLGVVFLVAQAPFTLTFGAGFFFGVVCLVANTLFFALYTHFSKRWVETISPLLLTSGTMVSGALGLLVLTSFTSAGKQWGSVTMLTPTQWSALLFLALACSVIGYFAYNTALRTLDTSRVTVYFYLEPVISIVLGIVFLHERLTWQIVASTVMIGCSIFIINRIVSPA